MNIVHLVETMGVGGAEILVGELCRHQAAQGHDVVVGCLYAEGPLAEELRRDGYQVELCGPGSRWRLTSALRRFFGRYKPDVVHCHNATATILGAPVGRWAGAGSIVSTRHGLVNPPYLWKREVQFGLASRFCSYVVGVCDATARNLREAPLAASDRVIRVYNGTRPPGMRDEAGSISLRPGFAWLQVGRLAPPKDAATLVEAAALTRKAVPNLVVWIVGDGPQRADLEVRVRALGAEDRVCFLGQRRDIRRFFEQADVFVLSSRSEGLPVSLLEAMSMGKPAVVSETGGMPEVVNLCHAGWTVAPGDAGAIANLMERLAGDREALCEAGENARRGYEKHFTIEAMASEYEQLYQT